MEQTVYLGTTTTDVVVYTQAIDSSGIHVALVVNTSTSKLVFADGTVSSATPTVASLGTGKAKVTFASIANSSLSAGDTVAVRINGTADGVAFSEYMIPVFIATASSGGGGSSLTQADIRTAVGLASANLDTQLGDIPTVSEFNARTKATGDYFDHTSDQVVASNMRGTDNAFLAASAPTNFGSLGINSSGHIARVTLTDTTTTNTDMVSVSGLASSSDLSAVDTVVDAIKAVTDKLDTALVIDGSVYQFTTNALENAGGTDPASIYTYFTSSSRADTFKADVTSLATSASISALNDFDPATQTVTTDSASRTASQADVSALATSSDLATVDSNVDSIKAVTDQMVFTVSGQIDANALTGGGGDDAATIYSYFTASNREDQFKADVSSISQVGSGAISHEITVNVGGSPSDGVEVWVSTDASGNNVVAGTLVTDAFGKATFMLDAGSYYLWAQKAGTNFTNPTTFSVS